MWDDFRKLKRTRNGTSNFIKLFRGTEWKIGEFFNDNQNVVCIACKVLAASASIEYFRCLCKTWNVISSAVDTKKLH